MFNKHLIFVLLVVITGPATATPKPMDVALLAENTTVEDSNHRTVLDRVATQLADRLDPASRLSLSLFADKTLEIQPLQPVTEGSGQPLSNTLHGLSQDAAPVNPAAALEQTIYHLRTAGRGNADKLIIVLGDGVIDTGDAIHNTELTEWLREGLTNEARRSGIRIYWLTFSESANYRIIQTVTQKTGGSYYRAYNPADALLAIEAILAVAQRHPVGKTTTTAETSPQATQAEAIDPWTGLWPTLVSRPVLWGSALGVTLGLLIGGFYLRHKSGSKKGGSSHSVITKESRALLRDLSHFTGMLEYDITDKRTYIGRQPREVTERSCIIIISDTSVGRNHAIIECRDKQYWISDVDTVNGTYLNGRRLSESRQLCNGDKVRFARFEFAVTLPQTRMHDAADIAETLSRTHTATETIPDDKRTVFRSRH